MIELTVAPINPQSVEYKFADAFAESGDYWNSRQALNNQRATPAVRTLPVPVVPQPRRFTSQNQMGTAGYSQDMAGYLNALSLPQLEALGNDFDITGLAREDLSSMSPWQEGSAPQPGQVYNPNPTARTAGNMEIISKYRNIDSSPTDTYGHKRSLRTPLASQGHDDGPAYEEVNLWGTRNEPGTKDTVYEYGPDGSFGAAAYQPNEKSWLDIAMQDIFPYVVGGTMTAGLGAMMAPAAAGAGAAAGGGGGSGLGMGGAATGTAGGLGSSTSLISGAGSLNLGMGSGLAGASGAGGAGLGSSVGLAYGGSLGTGVGAGLGASSSYGAGANALLSSPSFSLINGANSLNLGNVAAGRYALPESLKALDFSTDLGSVAQKAKKAYDKFARSGGQQPPPQQQQQQQAGGGYGTQSVGGGVGEASQYIPPEIIPYQFRPQEMPQIQGYSNALKRRT